MPVHKSEYIPLCIYKNIIRHLTKSDLRFTSQLRCSIFVKEKENINLIVFQMLPTWIVVVLKKK